MKNIESKFDWELAESAPTYNETEYPLQKETYEIIGICMEVHRILGAGFQEIVYKDALQLELEQRKIMFEREKKYYVNYKGQRLPHAFFADFVIHGEIIFEVKAQSGLAPVFYSQVLNYLAVSEAKIGLLVNFGETSLKYKRVILNKKKSV